MLSQGFELSAKEVDSDGSDTAGKASSAASAPDGAALWPALPRGWQCTRSHFVSALLT